MSSSLAPVDVIFNSGEIGFSNLVTGTTDNPVFTLLPPIENCVGVSLISATIPFTYFVIDQTNNQFQFINDTQANTPVTVNLDSGSYNVVNIVTQLKSKLVAAGITDTFEIYVDSTTTNLVMYRTSGNLTRGFAMRFTTLAERKLARILGFSMAQSDNTGYINAFSNTSSFRNDNDVTINSTANLAAANNINLTGENDIYVDSEISSSIFGSIRNQAGNKSYVGYVKVNSNYQGTISHENYNPVMIPMTSAEISRISLSLILGNRSAYQATPTSPVTPHLQLNGESFQIGIRFWIKTQQGEDYSDSMGNRSMAVGSTASRIFNPKVLRRSDVSGPVKKSSRI